MKQLTLFWSLLLLLFTGAAFSQGEGEYDPTFGNNGVVNITGIGEALQVESVAIQPDGKIVLGGYKLINNQKDFMVIRLNEDGSMDTSFGDGGIVSEDVYGSGYEELILDIRVLPSGKILGVGNRNYDGNTDYDAFAVRLHADGSYDTSYGYNSGVTSYGSYATEYLYGCNTTSTGRSIMAGSYHNGTEGYPIIMSFDADGEIDMNRQLTEVSSYGLISAAEDGSGNIYAAGNDGTKMAVIKVDSNGDLVDAFNGDGILTFEGTAGISWEIIDVLEYDPAQHMLLACGRSGGDIHLSRIDANAGVRDQSFGTGGSVKIDVWGNDDYAADLAIAPDGKILIFGRGEYSSTDDDIVVIRLNADGSMDTSFGDNGIVYFHQTNESGRGGAVMANGKIVVAGTQEGVNAVVVRYQGGTISAVKDLTPAAMGVQVYPNPVAGQDVRLDYELEESTPVEVGLFDSNGRELAVLVRADRLAGPHSESLSLPQQLPGGIYMLRIQTDLGVSTQRLVVQ